MSRKKRRYTKSKGKGSLLQKAKTPLPSKNVRKKLLLKKNGIKKSCLVKSPTQSKKSPEINEKTDSGPLKPLPATPEKKLINPVSLKDLSVDLQPVTDVEQLVCDNTELIKNQDGCLADENMLDDGTTEEESSEDERPPPSHLDSKNQRHNAVQNSSLNSNSDDDYANDDTSESEFQIDLSREEEDEEMEEDNPSQNFCIACNLHVGTRSALTAHMKQHSITNNQTHQCLICNKILSSASSLDRHMLIHSGERPFKCKLCDMSFTTNGNMHRHMRTHGDVETSDSEKSLDLRKRDVIKCDISEEACQESEPDKKIHCPVCGKTFLCKYGLQSHMETHPNDPILCQKCDIISANYNAHVDHKCNTLGSKQPIKCYNLPCGFQDLTFMDFTSNKFSLVSKSYCEQNVKRPSSAFHKFECQKCSKAFPCSRALKLHEKVHETEIGTFCPSCHCDFPASPYLQLHQLKHRSVEHCFNPSFQNDMAAPFNKMPHAGKEDFLALLNLQTKQSHLSLLKNLRSCHVKEDNFENYDYFVHGKNSENDVKSDMEATSKVVNNNNNNDFADIQSIITVTSKAPLMTAAQTSPIAVRTISPSMYVSTHHPVSPPIAESASASPETPSKEEIPMSNQSLYDDDDTIIEIHGIFSCKICSQRFKNNSALKRHTKLHVQRGSNYSCHICSYVSVDKSTLIRHLRTHNGERPFQCVICKYAFTTKANCERHVRKRHKKFGKVEIRNAMQYNPNMSLRTSDPSTADISNSETVCKYCGVDFKFNRVLRHHLRSLHNSCNRKPFSCKICKFGFSTKNNCIRHVLKQHPNLKDKLRSVVIPNPQMPPSIHLDSMSGTDNSNSSIGNQTTNEQETQPLDLHCSENPEKPLDLQMDRLSNEFNVNETVIAAEGLVSLSEAPPLQVEPLNLAAHAIDLSCKPLSAVTRKLESKPSSIFSDLPHIPINDKSLDLSQAKAPFDNNAQISPLPCPKTKIDISPPIPGQKHRSFTCVYCDAGFTLKSNMERHIKRKHPEFARPTRSRNFIPSIITPNMQKQNISTLSDETRNALRHHVLNTKVQQVPVYRNFHPDVPFPNVTNSFKMVGSTHGIITPVAQVPTSTSVLNLSLGLKSKPEKITIIKASALSKTSENRDEPCSDLASVSSVICTANSPQFTQLLGKPGDNEKVDITEKDIQTDKSEEVNNFKKSDAPPVSCPFCERQFPWTSSLRRHILTHTGQKPFKCPKCSLWFTTKSNCERHLIRKHGHKGDLITRSVPDRPYKCNHCLTSTFSTQGNLRKHFYLKHWTKSYLGMNCKPHQERKDAELPAANMLSPKKSDVAIREHSYSQPKRKASFSCHFCDNSFGSANDLGSHMRQHNGVIYVCYLCRKTFPNHQICYNHFKTSHSLVYLQLNLKEDTSQSDMQIEEVSLQDKNVSSVACMICFQKMSSVEHLQQHFKTHLLKEKQVGDSALLKKTSNPIVQLSQKKQTSDANPNPAKKARVTKNKVKNSLLYIFSKTANNSTPTKSARNISSKAETTPEEDSDLIQNLLGISDSKTIDEMLVSPDNAARILGVKGD